MCLVAPCARRRASVECVRERERVSVSVSVGYVCLFFLSSRPSSILAAKSKSSPSQVESGRAIPRGPNLPIGLAPPPAPISFPAHHQGEPNSPGFSFPFDQRGPSLGRFSQPGLNPSPKLNSQGAYCAYLGVESSHGLLLLLLLLSSLLLLLLLQLALVHCSVSLLLLLLPAALN